MSYYPNRTVSHIGTKTLIITDPLRMYHYAWAGGVGCPDTTSAGLRSRMSNLLPVPRLHHPAPEDILFIENLIRLNTARVTHL